MPFLSGGDASLVLCVFPNQPEIVVVDTRKKGGTVEILKIGDIFDSSVCAQALEVIATALRSDSPAFKDIMDVPEQLHFFLRRASIHRIFELMGESEGKGSSIGLMMFTGDILKLLGKNPDRMETIVGELFGSKLGDDIKANLTAQLQERAVAEVTSENLSSKDVLKRILFDGDDDGPFKTIWRDDN